MSKTGRPSKFKPEYIDKIISFFDIEPYKKEIMETSEEYFKGDGDIIGTLKKKSEKYRLIPNKLPTLFGFARLIGVSYKTVWSWAFEKEEEKLDEDLKAFRNAYNEAKELQKEFIISLGLSGAANAPFAIFTAKNITDMRDKNETDITSGGKPLPIIQLNAIHSNDGNQPNNSVEEED